MNEEEKEATLNMMRLIIPEIEATIINILEKSRIPYNPITGLAMVNVGVALMYITSGRKKEEAHNILQSITELIGRDLNPEYYKKHEVVQ